MLILVLLVMVEVVLILVPPTSPLRKFILAETVMMWVFRPYQIRNTESPMVSSFIKGYSFGADGGSSFVVATSDGKSGMGPRTTHLSSQKVNYWIDGGFFFFVFE